jgi:transcriptional regulator with XRE-family HTH domain
VLSFGEYVKSMRVKQRITLREFCRLLNVDPSNWSKIERGILTPPKSKNVLIEIAKILNLKEKSEEWYKLIDLAAISHIPVELLESKSIVEKLPIFFRTLRGQKLTRKDWEELKL